MLPLRGRDLSVARRRVQFGTKYLRSQGDSGDFVEYDQSTQVIHCISLVACI